VETKNQPIGIFDSGIGGLTVARAIAGLMPNESFIYFGDTAHLPYGDKSSEAIKGYVKKITAFLLSHNCKMVVIACNTASAVGYQALLPMFADKDLLINVIDPVALYVAKHVQDKKVGIIGTKRTVSTRAYSKKIKKIAPRLATAELATPLLAPMVEEGYYNNNISQTIINSYLDKKPLDGIGALVLGCTHYPLIQPQIENYYQKQENNVTVIDSATVVAQQVQAVLANKNLLSTEKTHEYKFFVSDYTSAFESTARIFFREKVKLEYYPLWQ
jgi:glutamate racemase